MAWYYSASDERWNVTDAKDQAEAIEWGREHHDDGAPFEVAEGEARGPWPELFNYEHLADHIDDWNEDNSNEDGFCAEANLGRTELVPLLTELNAVWTAFIERHKPTSNLLNLGPKTAVPATEEYLARIAAEDSTPNKQREA